MSPADTECIMERTGEWSHEMCDAAESQQLYYASICLGGHRLELILKTVDDTAAREDAERICAKLACSGTEAALLSVSRVKPE